MKAKLKAVHTHAGTEYQPGAEIEVEQVDYDFLLAVGVIEEAAAKSAAATNAEGTTR